MVWYNNAKALLLDPTFGSPVDTRVNINDDPTQIALMKTSYSVDIDSHVDFSDISASEISASDYSQFGATLSGKSLAVDTANDRAELTCDNLTFSGIGNGTNDTFDQIVVLRKPPVTGQTTANTLLIAHSTVASTTTNGGDITLQFSGEGLLQVS